jgi:hypothetical protein
MAGFPAYNEESKMTHIVTGEIRKAPFTKDGSNNNGAWKMYSIELSESHKPREGDRVYTNFRAVFFAKESQMQWYDEAFQEGKVVSVQSDAIEVVNRESNGKTYTHLEMINPKLLFSQRGGNQQQQPQQKQEQRQQTQQTKPQQQQQDFDSEIPF